MSEIIPTPNQPTLPLEVKWTEAELLFMEESPPGLFPENQNSNFGFIIRRVFSNKLQEAIDWTHTLWNERFVTSSSQFLDAWEIDYGLPPAPTGISVEQRRASVVARVQRGPFTRPRRDAIIRAFIETTYGQTVQLTEPGVPITGGGIQLFGESADVESLFDVIENVGAFSYVVWIQLSNMPNVAELTRELKRITPAGISFTVTDVHP